MAAPALKGANWGRIERLADWLQQNLPADSAKAALIHNDYKYDNLVLAPED